MQPFPSHWSTAANLLTLTRIVVALLFFLTMWLAPGITLPYAGWALLALLVLLESSDALDGWLARKMGQVSDLGKILDPMVDSAARLTLLLAFTLPPVSLPVAWLLPFLLRDNITATLRILWAQHGIALAARRSGKLKAICQGVAEGVIVLSILGYGYDRIALSTLHNTAQIVVALSALFALWAVAEYLRALHDQLPRMGR